MSGVNTFTIGDNTSGNKDYCEDSVTDRCIRWNETAGLWTVQQNGTTYSEIAVVTSTTGITQYSVLLGNGTSALDNVQGLGTSGQVLTSNGGGSRPTFQASGAGSYFVGNTSRDTSLASGTQAITGVGFQPGACIIHMIQNSATTGEMSWGFMSGTAAARNESLARQSAAGGVTYSRNSGDMIFDAETATDTYEGTLSSFDSGGFTISWTRGGTPTGTIQINYLCYR